MTENNERQNLCIFCGQTVGFFKRSYQKIEDIEYLCCMNCAAELSGLSEVDLCRRALRIPGMLDSASARRISARIELIEEAENHRLKCLRCDTPMHFRPIEQLDNTPNHQDGLFSSTFSILPLRCPNCGKMELFYPDILQNNAHLAYLYQLDIQK